MSEKISRRAFLKVSSATAATLLASKLAGCAQVTPIAPAAEAPAVSAEPTMVVVPEMKHAGEVVEFLTHPVFEGFLPSFSDFEELTGIQVQFEGIPFPGIRDKIALELASNSTAYDLLGLGSQWWTYSMIPSIEPLDDLVAARLPDEFDKVNQGLLDINTVEGELIGWPIRSGVFILFYRKDLYEENGLSVPQTFAELRENARVLNDPPNIYGFYVMGTPDGFAHDDWVNTLFSFGGKIVSDDGSKCLLDQPEALAATQYWYEWIDEGLVPPGTAEHKYSDLITALQQGLAAQAIAWSPYSIPVTDPELSKFPDSYGFDVVPVWEQSGLDHSITFSTGWDAHIPKAAQNKGAAWEWLRWMTNPENDVQMALGGNGPVRDTTYTDSRYLELNPAAAATKEALTYGIMSSPPVEARPQIGQIVAGELSALAAGQQDPEDTLKNMNDQIAALL